MSDLVIETKKLTKIYGEQTAVNSVNLHVKPGRIYGLLGRNGAGKTTIMKMILGLTPITSGEVDVFGQNIKGHEKRIYPRIGAIIETPGFYPNLTGTENLEIFAKLRGTPQPNAVKNALEVVGCGHCGYALKATHVPNSTGYFRCTKRTENKGCPGCGKIRKEEFEQFIFSAMQEKFKDFQILHGREEKVNPRLTAYQVELAQVEAEIEKLLDTLTGANATLLAYANKKIEELDTRRQTISKAIAELSVETISPQQIKKLSYYLDNWDSIDFDDKRKAADGLISTIKATSDRVQIEWKI